MAHRILNVDDSDFALAKLKNALEQAGFEIVPPAHTVAEAIARIGEAKPDLVTLDIVIVGTDGVEGVRQILRTYPGTKIIMVSAMGQEGLMQQALANGAKGFVVKPYRDDDLVGEVRRVLGVA
jgi:two-component system, chemotaxis family, chemotaxis protein CheY